MSLFSKNKEKKEVYSKIPRTLPDTIMQKVSVAQNSKEGDFKKNLDNKYIQTSAQSYAQESNKSSSKNYGSNDEHKKFPDEFFKQDVNSKGPENHEVEKVLMIKNTVQNEQRINDELLNNLHQSEGENEHNHNLPSFFVELERRIFGKKHPIKHIVSQDLISRMKEYHDAVRNGDSFFMHELEAEEQIENSLITLKNLESDWLLAKKQVALAEKILNVKENELEAKLTNFKELLSSADRFKSYIVVAPLGQEFILIGGIKVYSIQNLINEMPRMSDEVFYFHVNSNKNDFASWVSGVFKMSELAESLSSQKTKQGILDVLKKH